MMERQIKRRPTNFDIVGHQVLSIYRHELVFFFFRKLVTDSMYIRRRRNVQRESGPPCLIDQSRRTAILRLLADVSPADITTHGSREVCSSLTL
ncbi:hypothetical protein Plhal710r2_c030g0112881 [Plasmopara halstedii]